MHADKDFMTRKMSQSMPEEVLFQTLQERGWGRHWSKARFSLFANYFLLSISLIIIITTYYYNNLGERDLPCEIFMALQTKI